MGIEYAVDLVVCCALGCDMFDFGFDFTPVDSECPCPCSTCRDHTRAYLHALFGSKEATACHLLIVHNVTYCTS
eukprot:m.188277 g.188277  ORF g.188277 m.188277 type:complete len:74 (+) comp39377_c0_seq3:559-780(+)